MHSFYVPEYDQEIVKIINPDFEKGPWICGGAPMAWVQGEDIGQYRDVDVYFKSAAQQIKFVMDMQVAIGYQFEGVCDTTNSTTFRMYSEKNRDKHWTVQAIKLYYSEIVEEIFEKFDITACKIATDGKSLRIHEDDTIHHIFDKILHMDDLKNNAVARCVKYMAKGYSLDQETYDKIAFASNTTWNFGYDSASEYSE